MRNRNANTALPEFAHPPVDSVQTLDFGITGRHVNSRRRRTVLVRKKIFVPFVSMVPSFKKRVCMGFTSCHAGNGRGRIDWSQTWFQIQDFRNRIRGPMVNAAPVSQRTLILPNLSADLYFDLGPKWRDATPYLWFTSSSDRQEKKKDGLLRIAFR